MQWENNKCNAIGDRPLDFEFNSLQSGVSLQGINFMDFERCSVVLNAWPFLKSVLVDLFHTYGEVLNTYKDMFHIWSSLLTVFAMWEANGIFVHDQ
jgi:hypothetical protein